MSETSNHYDRWSSQYDREDNPMIGATAWSLARDPLELRGRELLELGCGTGRLAPLVLDAGARRYVGVDASPAMLAHARVRCGRDPRARLVAAELDGRLPFEDASFDVVLVVLVFEHLTELEGITAEIARVLRPGGILRIVEIHPELVASGTVAHFRDDEGEVRFASTAHGVGAFVRALRSVRLEPTAVREHRAEGALLATVPKLAKHEGRAVVLDVEAVRGE